MSASGIRQYADVHSAPAPVRRQKRNLLRRHWLTSAFAIGALILSAYALTQIYYAEGRLRQVRANRTELESSLEESRWRNDNLRAELARVTSDPYMALKAKEMGFVWPHERVFQKGAATGQ